MCSQSTKPTKIAHDRIQAYIWANIVECCKELKQYNEGTALIGYSPKLEKLSHMIEDADISVTGLSAGIRMIEEIVVVAFLTQHKLLQTLEVELRDIKESLREFNSRSVN